MRAAALAAIPVLVASTASATGVIYHHGSVVIGDPCYPTYGNGGYDVSHYDIHVGYDIARGELTGTTTITARVTENLSRFDLDFLLAAISVTVNGAPAKAVAQYQVDTPAPSVGGELVVTPAQPTKYGQPMRIVVRYKGNPEQSKVAGFSPGTTHRPER